MNREERRRKQKQLQRKGYSKEKAKNIVEMASRIFTGDVIPEGTKVKLNLDKVEKGNLLRNTWIDSHKDDIFTVKYNPKYGENPKIVEFLEESNWLWHVGELTVLNENNK